MKSITLREYIKRRNGVPLGAKGSLKNMFYRSLGAKQFSGFWRYWNPIWSYYLSKLIYKPLRKKFTNSVAIILTFLISGLIHDIIVSLICLRIVFVVTPWFMLMSLCLVFSIQFGIRINSTNWFYRALANFSYISVCLFITLFLRQLYS